MQVPIRLSKQMTEAREDGSVRASFKTRYHLGLSASDVLVFKALDGSALPAKLKACAPSPEVKDHCLYISEAMFRQINHSPYMNPITFGSDPELLLITQRGNVYPADYLFKKNGQIGSDGSLLELRPTPAHTVDEAVHNLGLLIRQLPHLLQERRPSERFGVEAHSYYQNFSCGFHVHLGIPKELILLAADQSKLVLDHLSWLLDFTVGVPGIVLEKEQSLRRLGNSIYGKPGDYRLSNQTFEYRTAGGVFLRSPALTRSLFALAAVAAESYLADISFMSIGFRSAGIKAQSWKILEYYNLPLRNEVLKAFHSSSPSAARELLPKWDILLQKLPVFDKYKNELVEFKSILKSGLPTPNVIENWG